MLLVAKIDMIEKWAFPRKEGAGNFQSFGMPELAFWLFVCLVISWVFLHLKDESYLSRIAEVAHCKVANLLYKRVSIQFKFIFAGFKHILQQEGL